MPPSPPQTPPPTLPAAKGALGQRLWLSCLTIGLLALAPLTAQVLALPEAAPARRAGFIMIAASLVLFVVVGRDLVRGLAGYIVALAEHLGRLARGEAIESYAEVSVARLVEPHRLLQASTALTGCLAEMQLSEYLSVERTRDAERLKSQFLANMSHDLRSPLNAILGFSELLERGLGGTLTHEQKELVSAIHRRGNELLRMINQILDIAKLEAGRLELHREWIPAAECIAKGIQDARKLAGKRPFDLITELSAGLPPVQVDVTRVAQAIGALMVRSTDPKAGRIRINIRGRLAPGDPPYVEFVIKDSSDNTAPLTAIDQHIIVDPRGPGALLHAMSTIGLALPLARRFIEMHGGRLTIGDEGEKAHFVVALPAGTPAKRDGTERRRP